MLFELTDKLKTIRNASAERIWLARYADSLAAYQRSRFDNVQLGSRLQIITNGLVGLAGIVTLSVGALRVMDGAMSLGELIAAMMIVWRVLVPIQIVSLNIARLKQTLATVRQINEVVRMGTEREREAPPTLSRRLSGNILASGLYLSFGAQAEPQLRRRQPRGQGGRDRRHHRPERQRQIDPAQGDPRPLSPVHGHRPPGWARPAPAAPGGSSRRRRLCVAATGLLLWQRCRQLSLCLPRVPPTADIIEALAAVGLSLPHAALPHGLATRISSTGSGSLSQGLLCRLSIARALVKKPAILLLDDPGNGLDRAGDAALLLTSMRCAARPPSCW